jgi:heptosyltransferase-2
MLTESYRPDEETPVVHEVEYYLGLIRHFGITGQARVPLLTVTPAEDGNAAVRLAEQGITADDFVIGVNPGAAFGSAKRWYPERFAEVAGRLAAAWNAKVVIFGGPGETDIADGIEHHLAGQCTNLSGKTNLRELMALIKRCNFLVTNDSGPMHIAAACGVPLAAIFGSTDHAATSPYTDKAVIVCKDMECAPCKLRECPTDHHCMTAVSADDVVQAALSLLEKTTRTL